MGDNYFINGIPIDKKWKTFGVIIGFVLLVLNHNITVISSVFEYSSKDYVSLFILSFIVLISIGSHLAESIVIGLALFTVMSAWYDLSVLDVSNLRLKIVIGGIIVLIVATVFGKISLYRIFKGQLGLS